MQIFLPALDPKVDESLETRQPASIEKSMRLYSSDPLLASLTICLHSLSKSKVGPRGIASSAVHASANAVYSQNYACAIGIASATCIRISLALEVSIIPRVDL